MQRIMLGACPFLPRAVMAVLPPMLVEEVGERLLPGTVPEEIRLRRGHAASLTVGGKNIRLSTVLDGGAMDRVLYLMCEGSVYAHADTIKEGYLLLEGGIRVGVCGRAAVSEGRITGVDEIMSLSLRIPAPVLPIGAPVEALLREGGMRTGVLIYAPAGVGKTTILRAVAARMAGGEEPLRVALVDTRGELGAGMELPSLLLDVLTGYPRGIGVSVAARTLAAQLIVCDEIGDLAEAKEIVAAHIGGVALLASAHAGSVGELLARPGMRLLHEAKCFGAYVGITRAAGSLDFHYRVTKREEADDDL